MLMNIYLQAVILFIGFSNTICSINLLLNRLHKDTIQNSNLKFYKVNFKKDMNMDIALETELTKYDQKTKLPIMILSTKPLPNSDRSSQWICGSLGKEKCVVPREYIKDINSLSVGVFCEECEYTLKYSYENNQDTHLITEKQNELRTLVSLPSIRLLQQPETSTTNEPSSLTPPGETTLPVNPTSPHLNNQSGTPRIPNSYWRSPSSPQTIEEKLDALRGAGVAGLLFGIMFILCVIIAYYIHVVIFVNTKFITEPLKLGKIE